MKLHFRSLVPTRKELLLSALLAIFLTLLGNTTQIFGQPLNSWLGTATSQDGRAVAAAVATKVDSYPASPTLTIFTFWIAIGLAIVAGFQGIVHTLQRVAHLQRLRQQARRAKLPNPWQTLVFWKQFLLTSVGSFLALSSAIFIFSLFIGCILPIGLIYSQTLELKVAPLSMYFGLMGMAMLMFGLLLVIIGVRLIYNRRSLIRLS